MTQVPVSVVIPVRNGALYIGAALQSVLKQTSVPQQIIVVDDGSTDATATEVRRFGDVEYFEQAPLGVSSARNKGARHASMPYLAFLDADDIWMPTKIEQQLEYLEGHSDIDVVGGQMSNFKQSESGEMIVLGPPAVVNVPGILLLRRESFWRAGPFSSELAFGENLEWWARAADAGLRLYAIPELLLMRRIHGANSSEAAEIPVRQYLRALQTIVSRRRNDG
jgi:GT2 family glycosyltransferase